MFETLEDRMKFYESRSNQTLERKIPVVGRVDGKSFSKFTRGLKKAAGSPWSPDFVEAMTVAAVAGCKEIQGCQMAYVQSDEISFLVTDTATPKTEAYFGYKTRKMNSIVASTVSVEFFASLLERDPSMRDSRPRFDSRFWNVSPEEVVNTFIWRQQDAIRNSVQMLARHYFSHKDCHKKSVRELREMLRANGTPWEDIGQHLQRGITIVRREFTEEVSFTIRGEEKTQMVTRKRWVPDMEIPIFSEDRDYIGCHL